MIFIFLVTIQNMFIPEVNVYHTKYWKVADTLVSICEQKPDCFPIAIEIKSMDTTDVIVYKREYTKQWKSQVRKL